MRLKAPDQVAIAAWTESGAVVGAQIVGGPPTGASMSLTVQGTGGTLRATSAGYMHWRPVEVEIAEPGAKDFGPVPIPDKLFALPRNAAGGPDVTLAYGLSAFGEAIRSGRRFRPDFADAVGRHRMLDAIAVQPPT